VVSAVELDWSASGRRGRLERGRRRNWSRDGVDSVALELGSVFDWRLSALGSRWVRRWARRGCFKPFPWSFANWTTVLCECQVSLSFSKAPRRKLITTGILYWAPGYRR